MNLQVSLISTVLNEATTIRSTLDAIYRMTRRPNEVIFVDAGSTDGTAETIKDYSGAVGPLRLIVEPSCSIARGRNIAIDLAVHDIIAIIDGGASPDMWWLERLMYPLENWEDVDIVAGWTVMTPATSFERYVSMLQRPFEKTNLDQYLPSARSIAFRKSCWRAVNGFPEELTNWAEDTVLVLRFKQAGFRMVVEPKAAVHWRPRSSLRHYWAQHFRYGFGDGEAGLHRTLYLKRCLLATSLPLFVIGLLMNGVLAVLAAIIALAGFVRLVVPLKSETTRIWHLPTLFALVLAGETARVAGYGKALLKRRRRAD